MLSASARAATVDRVGHQRLARPALAGHQHGGAAGGDGLDEFVCENNRYATFSDQLKRQDMQDVAAWFSSQPSVLQRVDQSRVVTISARHARWTAQSLVDAVQPELARLQQDGQVRIELALNEFVCVCDSWLC